MTNQNKDADLAEGWHTSSLCTRDWSCQCAQVRRNEDGTVSFRNSETPDAVTTVPAADWDVFLAGAKQGDFDQV